MIAFGLEMCPNLEAATQGEWLATHGLGGFASSMLIGLNTRRYHGLLAPHGTPCANMRGYGPPTAWLYRSDPECG
jgi:hypothetical protein